MRQFEVKAGDNEWIPCKITDIRNMDTFRIIDSGEIFVDSFGESEFVADGTAYLNKYNILEIQIR